MQGVPFSFILWSCFVLDGLICAVVLWGPWRRRELIGLRVIHLSDVLLAALAVMLALGLRTALVVSGRLTGFGLMHMAYLDLVILAPLAAMTVLWLSTARAFARLKLRMTRPAMICCCLALLGAPVGVYSRFIEPNRLLVERSDVLLPAERAGRSPITIGVLADFQTDRISAHECSAIERLMAGQPDIILLPGDLFHGPRDEFERQLPALRELMHQLTAPGGVFFVMGDTERWWPEYVERAFEGTQVRVIINEIVQTRVKDHVVTIGGSELNYRSRAASRMIRQLDELPGQGDLRILLSHRPDVALELNPESRIDLVVAGHTHGGQVCIPGFGPPITFSGVPRAVAAGGLHELQGNLIYVSRGVGHERGEAPRIRFLCPPEVSLLTLSPASPALASADGADLR